MAAITCSITDDITKFNMVQLNKPNKTKYELWILLVQLFIELYYFNTDDFDIEIVYIDPVYIIDKNYGGYAEDYKEDPGYDNCYVLSYVSKDPLNTCLYEFMNYNPATSTNNPNISKDKLQSLIGLIFYYLIKRTKLKKSTIKANFFMIIKHFIEKLKTQIGECADYLNVKKSTIMQFNDSRIFSISMLLIYLTTDGHDFTNYHLITLNYNDDRGLDSFITHAHVFIISHYDRIATEAISIQTSLLLLNDNICNKVSCKIAERMFAYIFVNNPYEGANYFYAYAWPILSDILMKKFNFVKIKTNESEIKVEYNEGHPDFMSGITIPIYLLGHGDNYIPTFKKLR